MIDCVAESWRSGWTPDPLLLVSEWADKNRKLGSKSAAEPGDWRTDRVPYAREPMDILSVTDPTQTVVLMWGAQTSKALALDTPIPTPTGWSTMGDLRVGDELFDQDGKVCRVTHKSEVFRDHRCYEVEFSDGSVIVADAGHRWETLSGKHQRPGVHTTEEIAASVMYRGNRFNHAIPVTEPLDTASKTLPIDPYALGVWLGDGNRCSAQITSHKDDVMHFARAFARAGHRAIVRRKDLRTENTMNIIIDPTPKQGRFCKRGHDKDKTGRISGNRCAECGRQISNFNQGGNRRPVDPIHYVPDSFSLRLRALGLHLEKRIPDEYLRASARQRLLLLKGLMDTDGTIDKTRGGLSFCSASKLLIDQFYELSVSLGLKPTIKRLEKANAWTVNFMAYRDVTPVFDLPRKLELMRYSTDARARPTETMRRRIVAVRPVPSVPVQCIAVDSPRHLFLAGHGMIATHNTETGNNWLGYIIHHAPGPVMVCQPTVDMAKRLSKQRLSDMIEQSPALKELIGDARSRDSSNTMLSKEFPGGVMILTGANSATGLRSAPCRYVFADEVDAWPQDVDGEGDPLSLAIKRTTTFGRRRKVLITSTPTIKDVSRVEKEYEKSDKRRYYVACPHCGFSDWLRWRGYTDDHDDPRAKEYRLVWLNEAKTEAGYKCGGADCGALIEEYHKTKMLLGGRWVPTAPGDGKTRGYQLSSLYSPLGWLSWVELLQEFEAAAHDPAQLKTFVNTRLAETWEDASTMRLDAEGLAARAGGYTLGTVPFGGLVLTAGVDFQRRNGGYAQIVVRAWGDGDESWLVDRKLIHGDQNTPEFWGQVWEALRQHYPHAGGGTVGIYASALDSGDGEHTHSVYAFCREHRLDHVIATKGRSTPGGPVLGKPTRQDVNIRKQTIKRGVDLWSIGPDTAKSLIHGRLRMEIATGAGVIHWPAGLPDDYWKQLTSEKQTVKLVNGFPKRVWVKKDADYNEDLDCEILALSALEYVKTRHNRATFWAQMAARLGKQAPDAVKSDVEVPIEVVPAPTEPVVAGRITLSKWGRGK